MIYVWKKHSRLHWYRETMHPRVLSIILYIIIIYSKTLS